LVKGEAVEHRAPIAKGRWLSGLYIGLERETNGPMNDIVGSRRQPLWVRFGGQPRRGPSRFNPQLRKMLRRLNT
jgi:hypothetical protein